MPKTVHLIRHGQSTFNAAHLEAPGDPMLFDARLSPLGEKQVEALRRDVADLAVELVVASPLTRAIQTAVGAFGIGRVPFVIEALHCERLESSCDVGRSPAELTAEFAHLQFEHLDDPWWHSDGSHPQAIVFEPDEILMGRVSRFRDWLGRRPEREIAVIGHGTFFNRMTGHVFANCERLTITV